MDSLRSSNSQNSPPPLPPKPCNQGPSVPNRPAKTYKKVPPSSLPKKPRASYATKTQANPIPANITNTSQNNGFSTSLEELKVTPTKEGNSDSPALSEARSLSGRSSESLKSLKSSSDLDSSEYNKKDIGEDTDTYAPTTSPIGEAKSNQQNTTALLRKQKSFHGLKKKFGELANGFFFF